MKKSIIISGGGSRVAWVQGLLANPIIRKRFKAAEVYAGVSAGAIMALLCARYVDTPNGLERLSQRKLNLIPHWGGVAGIFVSSLFKKYVFSHRQMCDALYAHLSIPNGEDAIIARAVSIGVCDIARNQYEEKHFPVGTKIRESRIIDWVAASCAIYGVFEGWRRGDELYQDGGYSHNVPRDALRSASSDSMIISLVPLDGLVGEYGGNGFWKFLMSTNLAFYSALYEDLNHRTKKFNSKHVRIYTSPHGDVWTPTAYSGFTLTYKKKLLEDLRISGYRAACEGVSGIAGIADIADIADIAPRHTWIWLALGTSVVVLVIILTLL